ncbi:MAG: hypothetical protein IPG45_23035 [Deltaproteobacteria bacterium]|nr:hypothetical protein [Deltaproteobacteria bacterium]
MSPLLQLLLAAKLSLLLIAGWTFGALLAVLLAARRSQSLQAQSSRLLLLALEGKADQARIQARNGGRALAPLLEALGGELAVPSPRPLLQDLGWIVLLSLGPIGLLIRGLSQLLARDGGDKTPSATALLVGLSILLPVTTLASVAIVQLSRKTARAMRGHCISLLAKSVKIAVEAETAEALRRGANPPTRDPRGA